MVEGIVSLRLELHAQVLIDGKALVERESTLNKREGRQFAYATHLGETRIGRQVSSRQGGHGLSENERGLVAEEIDCR